MVAIGYQHYLDVASARDVPAFKRRLEDFAGLMGFGLVNATLVVEQSAKAPAIASVRNSPEAFETSSSDRSAAARDPVIQRLRASSAPFVYDQGLYVAHGAGDLWEEQAPFGYRTGISMALHLSGGRHFLFGVDRPDALPSEPDQLVRMLADLQLLAVFAQETAVRLLMPQLATGEPVGTLTAREREVLQWVLVSKSNGVIAQILRISESTVKFHLRQAMHMLGVASKHQAAAKAQALGLL